MKTGRIVGALFGMLAAWQAVAGVCTVPPEPKMAPVPRASWQDIAKFAFMVGNDSDAVQGNMQLASRLRTFGSFANLHASGAAWRDTRARSRALAAKLVALDADLLSLANLCQQLDDAGMGGKPLDFALWTQKMDGVRRNLATTVVDLQGNVPSGSFRNAMETFALSATNAARSYSAARFPESAVLPVSPDPVQTAGQIEEIWGRWRAIIVDVAHLSSTLPQRPDPDSEKVLADIASAMPQLARTISSARSIHDQDIAQQEFDHLVSGDYFYDACAIEENTSYYLYTARYSLTALIRDPASTNFVVGHATGPTWRFRRIGMGYWQILDGSGAALAADKDIASKNPLSTIPANRIGPQGAAQTWRCFGTPQQGQYRFVTQLLGETRSLGLAKQHDKNGRIQVKMIETANESEQYWAAWPR
ncbi:MULTISPECIES: hypothetical protein [unclassified Variovorax]|uniref:hypothetical protein n=1 Tax=unclassified Variovorax TaxID=663243 RepID=UPI001BD58D59|nr:MULTISPECIES: hypothetical protein [unclassified Variovorax]